MTEDEQLLKQCITFTQSDGIHFKPNPDHPHLHQLWRSKAKWSPEFNAWFTARENVIRARVGKPPLDPNQKRQRKLG